MSVACVDTNSPVFKNKAKELGISEGQLENILHEYNNSLMLQSQFTEDQYIESKLNGLPNTQASDIMVEAWEKVYSEPKTFDNIEDFNRAKIQAISIFGEQAVGHRETVDGKHILAVAEPFNKEVYQKEIDSIKEKAIADGTFMKAPNGSQSNLNEQQWLQVRTKAFKRWFGNWENDPENASKVVDENGEPLVVYHGTYSKGPITEFSVDKIRNGGGFWFTTERGEYGNTDYATFLNLRNPYSAHSEFAAKYGNDALDSILEYYREQDAYDRKMQDYYTEKNLYDDGVTKKRPVEPIAPKRPNLPDTAWREAQRILFGNDQFLEDTDYDPAYYRSRKTREAQYKLGFDGEITSSGYYVVFNPNQIKSATGNIGTFSTIDNNVYFNRQVVPLAQRLDDANIIHKLNGKYYLSIKGEENGVQRRKQELQNFLDRNNYRDVVVDYTHTGRAVEVAFNTPSEHNDLIAREVDRSMSSIKNVMSFLEEKVPAIKGHIHYNTTVEEARKLLGRALLPEETSFVRGNQIYLIKGRATREGSIEEVLHVITNTLLMDNRSLASSLLREAKQLFPQLASEIEQDYKDYDRRERNLELLTQALSRVFRQEYDATKPSERVKVENFLRKFIDWIRNLFGFRENSQTGNKIIELDKLPKVMSLKDFATLINSADGEFSTGERDIVQFNRYKIEEQDRPYITENMVVAGTSKSVTSISELMKEIENISDIQGPFVPVSVPYSSWKSLDMPYETPSAKTLLGNIAVMANDWDGEHFDYNKRDKTISVPKYWYEVAKLLSKNRDIIKALDELDRLSPEDFADNMSNSDFKIINSYFSNGDYGTLELLFSSESDLEAFVNAGMISFSYTDSRQGSLFDAIGNSIEKENIQEHQATQQQEPQTLQPIRKENMPFFLRQRLLSQKIDALNENEVGLTTSEIDSEATMLVDWISDQITEIQQHPEKYYELFGKPKSNDWASEEDRKKDIDSVKSMSRRSIISNIGINTLIDAYRTSIFEDNTAIDDLSGRDYSKAMLLKDNLDVLFELGKGVFKNNEGYAIKHNDELDTYETVETTEDNTVAEEVPDDGAEVAEEQGNLEDWILDKTTIEVLNGASALIRSALGKLYILDENGQPVTDYLGRRQRVSQNDAVKSIIRWIQGSRNVDEMVIKLSVKAKENTWITPIINRLNDRSGNETAFISQFNTVFDKHFRLFDVIKKQKGSNGKNYALEVNSHPAVTDAMNYITAMQSIGKAPLFTTRGINSANLAQWEAITSRLEANANVTEEQFNKYKDGYVARLFSLADLLGYPITKETIQKSLNFNNFNQAITAARNILTNLKAEVNNPEYSPYTYVENGHYISGYVRNLMEVLVDSVEDTTENSFYENGKMRQSNLIPSYASKLFQKLTSDKNAFDKVMAEEFGKYEWFYDKTMGWRLPVLQDLAKMDENTRKKVLVHKVNLNFQGEQYMRGLSAERYILSVLTEFASGENTSDDSSIKTAFYGFPMQSNKASSDFLSLFRYTGDLAKTQITSKMLMVFGQELSRIQTVRKRDRKKGDIDYIEGFDERGRNFCLLDFFNDPSKLVRKDGKITAEEAEELHSLIEDKVAGKKVNNGRLESLARKAIEENFDQRYEQFRNQCVNFGLMDSIRNIEGVIAKVSKYPPQKQVDDFIENFVWNDALAKINIIELLVTDPAYYKNDDDFQKRFAQVHSPGTRGYADATDFEGNKVSDGYMRAVVLKDGIIDGKALKNNIIENLSVILDRDIEKASADTKEAAIAVKESILGRMEGINVSDGQALSGLTATRKKGFLFGNWTREAEKVYNKLRNGEYNIEDLETAFNVKKPFVYTQLSQDVHTEGTPLQTLKVPTQFKDSEYLLIMAAALMEGKETGKPNLLKVLYDISEESAYDTTDAGETYNGKGIDIFVFESGVKSGLTGVSDVTTRWANGEYEGKTVEQMEESLKQHLRNFIYVHDENGNRAYNDVNVKAIPVEDYAIQNEVPLHMRDHTQIWGSQMRSILESNLLYADFEGNPVTFTFTDSKGETYTLNREAFIKAYEEASRAISDEAVDSIRKELGLSKGNPIDTKVAIAKVLQNEISSNPGRYGNDLLLACTIDEYGNFRIPPGDPIQSKRIEQLVNSIVKNRLNKPKVPGGLGVQVSNFGTSRRLNIRFFMKDGKTLLPTRDEWLAKNPDKTADDYTKFCKENQGGYAYEENYAPAHTRAFFDLFTDRNGNIDLEAIEMLDDTLLYSIDQRTPTEFYYSVSVAKIVGFMPKEAGDGFMRPYEITEKDDSDFDVDKETKWKKSFKIKRNKERITNKQLREAVPQLENIQLTEDEKQAVIDMVENRLSWAGLTEERYEKVREKQIEKELEKARQNKINTIVSDFRASDIFSSSADKPAIWKALKQAYIKLQFSVEYPSEGAQAAMNDAWEMSRAVMQHESNASKIMSPGGPDAVTRRGYIIGALKTGRYTEEQLNAMSTKELGDIAKSSNMNLVWFTNQVEYYKRNNDASSNLGIFAVANTAHNILEGQGYGVMNDEAFNIAGKYFGEEVVLDDTADNKGISISKTLGGNVGAAADAAKTPSHAFMNVNGNTINEFLFLLRAGLNLDDATLFIASKPIEDLVQRFNAENVSGYKPMDVLLEETLQKIADAADIKKDSRIYQEELTHEELVDLVSGKGTTEKAFKALLMFKRIRNLTEGMRALTFATRYNSVASAVGPQIVDNLIHEHTVNSYADTKNSNTIQRNFRYEYTKDDNREVKFGDKVEDNNGSTVILTPDNVEDLQKQGIISIVKSYKKVGLGDILRAHPMLSGFAQGYSLANEIFTILRMPANSTGFKSVLNADKTVSDFLYKDKKILSAFSDFYQSYLLIAGNVINTKNEKYDGPLYYMRKFPSDFLKVKDRYTGNALIDAIVPEVRDGVISLKVRTTGIKAEDRAKLQAAWNQLYKQNQKLAIDLFKYNFWRGGIGFSPKTFMNLLPIQMKERIDGYNDTYRNFPDVDTSCVIDQFFLNNASNNRIVRNVDSIKEAAFADNVYTFTGAQHETFKSLPFFRWKDSEGQYHIFKQTFRNDKFKTVKFVEVEALGNGGEFLEMSANAIVKPIIRSTEFEESDFISDTESSTQPSTVQPVQRSDAQIQAEIEDVLNYLKGSEGNYLEGINVEKLKDRLYKIKSGQETPTDMNLKIWKNSLKERFKENGIEYSDSEIDKIVKKFC